MSSRADNETVAWFHCFAGIAGDMALGSLIDAGADVTEIRRLLQRLSLPDWELEVEEALRGGVACTRALVRGGDAVVVRTHAHIAAMITDAALPPRVADRSLAVFQRLAAAQRDKKPDDRGDVHSTQNLNFEEETLHEPDDDDDDDDDDDAEGEAEAEKPAEVKA